MINAHRKSSYLKATVQKHIKKLEKLPSIEVGPTALA